MKLSCFLKCTSVKAIAEWAPRAANDEADALPNRNTSSFDPSRRIPSRADNVHWDALPAAHDMGLKMEADTIQVRHDGAPPERARKVRRR